MTAPTQQMLRQRKMLLVIPLLVLPFLALFFWAMGGGKTRPGIPTDGSAFKGLNMQMPDPQSQGDKSTDKFSAYQQAEKDSIDRRRNELADSSYVKDTSLTSFTADTINDFGSAVTSRYSGSANRNIIAANPEAEKMARQLAALDKQLADAQSSPEANSGNPQLQSELDQMNTMMKTVQGSGATDPEMSQLNGMLDKILDIEHPERAQQRIREQSLKNRKQAYVASSTTDNNDIQLLSSHTKPNNKTAKNNTVATKRNAFYELAPSADKTETPNSFEAEISGTRILVAGATLKMRLLGNMYINGTLLPAGQFIYGTCSISGDRLMVQVSSVKYGNSIFPIDLSVYDMDGIGGIYIPDGTGRQVAKNSAGETIAGASIYSFDNTLTGQAASAGIQAAKSLFGKKAQIVRVTVRDGYKVLLKNTNENSN